jgi:hypothetical protein
MSSFIVRIDNLGALLRQWKELLTDRKGPTFILNEQVLKKLSQWPRIKWFYYCDDRDGNTIRLYDTEHLSQYGQCYYLESNHWSKEHYERVVIRGRRMWSGTEADVKRTDSLRLRFRRESPWRIYGARRAPLRPVMPAMPQLQFDVHCRVGNPSTVDIQGGMCRDLRLWYFEAINQLPLFSPQTESSADSCLDDLDETGEGEASLADGVDDGDVDDAANMG